jgi:tetratricopeptide (TPR) repeat protein
MRIFTKFCPGAGLALMCLLAAGFPAMAGEDKTPQPAAGQARLVMVKIPHWKVKFFALPEELPLLLEAGETFDPKARVYDFSAGLQAMEIFLQARPHDTLAPAFRRFQSKWPIYQKFFQAVEAEDFKTAEDLLTQILRLDPREPAVHFYYGSLNTQLGRYAQAEQDYQMCLELYPGYGPAYINLARLAMARQDKTGAADYLKQALEKTDETEQGEARRLAGQMLKSLEGK